MAERIVYWKAIADFSQLRAEAKRAEKSLKDLRKEVDQNNLANEDLGKSEEATARKTKKSSQEATSAYTRLAEAKKKQRDESKKSEGALRDETVAARAANVESARRAKLLADEAAAQTKVANAERSLANARNEQTRTSTNLSEAENDLSRARTSGTSTDKQLESAEKRLRSARDAHSRSIDKVRDSESQLATTESRLAEVRAANTLEVQKAAKAEADAVQKRAKAAEDAAAKEQKAAEKTAKAESLAALRRANAAEAAVLRQQRAAERAAKSAEVEAARNARAAERDVKAAQRRTDADERAAQKRAEIAARLADRQSKAQSAQDAREAAALGRQAKRDEAALRATIERNARMVQEYEKLRDARMAADSVTPQRAPARNFSQTLAGASNARRLINDTPADNQSRVQVASANALTRAENQLKIALDNETSSYDRLTTAQRAEAVAKSVVASQTEKVSAAKDRLKTVQNEEGVSALRVAQAQSEVSHAEKDLERAQLGRVAASNAVTRANDAVRESTTRVTNASSTLGGAIRRAEREFAGAERSATRLGRVLGSVRSGLDKVDSKLGSVAGKLHGLFLPAMLTAGALLVGIVSNLVSGLFALGSAIAPAIGGLAAAIPVAVSLAGAFAAVKLAFSGMGGVLKAYQAEQLKAASTSSKSAKNEQDNADRIRAAQQALKDAREQVGITAKGVADQIASASRQIVESDRAQIQAQQDLTQARKDALKNINDLKNAVIDAALAEKGAMLDVADAQDNLQKVMNDPTASRTDRERAKLQVQTAQQSAKEATQSTQQATQASDSATAKGVSGDDGVIKARQALADANYQAAQAQKNYNDTVIQGARDNRKALEAVADAQRALRKAMRDIATGTDAASTAADTYQAKLNALPASAQKFVKHLIGMKHYLTDLKTVAADNMFPGLTKGIDKLPKLMPVLKGFIGTAASEVGKFGNKFATMITSKPWIASMKQFSGATKPLMGSLGGAMLKFANIFRLVGVAAIPLAEKLAKGINAWATNLNKATEAASVGGKDSKLSKFFDHSYKVLHQLGQIFKNLFKTIYNVGKAATGSGQDTLNSIQKITKRWAAWTGSPDGQGKMKKFFADVRRNMKIIDGMLGSLSLNFLKMGASKSLGPIVQALRNIGGAVKDMFSGTGGAGGALASLLNNIADVIRDFGKYSAGFKVFVTVLNGFLTVIKFLLGIRLADIPIIGQLIWFIDKLTGTNLSNIHILGVALGGLLAIFAGYKALKFTGLLKLYDLFAKLIKRTETFKKLAGKLSGLPVIGRAFRPPTDPTAPGGRPSPGGGGPRGGGPRPSPTGGPRPTSGTPTPGNTASQSRRRASNASSAANRRRLALGLPPVADPEAVGSGARSTPTPGTRVAGVRPGAVADPATPRPGTRVAGVRPGSVADPAVVGAGARSTARPGSRVAGVRPGTVGDPSEQRRSRRGLSTTPIRADEQTTRPAAAGGTRIRRGESIDLNTGRVTTAPPPQGLLPVEERNRRSTPRPGPGVVRLTPDNPRVVIPTGPGSGARATPSPTGPGSGARSSHSHLTDEELLNDHRRYGDDVTGGRSEEIRRRGLTPLPTPPASGGRRSRFRRPSGDDGFINAGMGLGRRAPRAPTLPTTPTPAIRPSSLTPEQQARRDELRARRAARTGSSELPPLQGNTRQGPAPAPARRGLFRRSAPAAGGRARGGRMRSAGRGAAAAGGMLLAAGGQMLGDMISDGKGGARDVAGGAVSGAAAGAGMGMMFGPIGAAVGAGIGALTSLLSNPKVRKALVALWTKHIWPFLKSIPGKLVTWGKNLLGWIEWPFKEAWKGITKAWNAVYKAVSNGITTAINWVKSNWPLILAALTAPFGGILVYLVVKFWPQIIGFLGRLWKAIVSALKAAGKFVLNAMLWPYKEAWKLIKAALNILKNVITNILNNVGNVVRRIGKGITNFFKNEWNGLKAMAGVIWNGIKAVIVTPIENAFGTLKSAWSGVWAWLKSAWNTAKVFAGRVWKDVAGAVTGAFSGVGRALGTVWQGVENVFSNAINFVTQKILNPLIDAINWVITKFGLSKIGTIDPISGASAAPANLGGGRASSGRATSAAEGNVLPGYSPGSDTRTFVDQHGHKLNLSGGEGILTPETTRALGGKTGIDALNAAHSPRLRDKPRFKRAAREMGAFADGGNLGTPDQKQGNAIFRTWRFARKIKSGSAFGPSVWDTVKGVASDAVGLLRKGAGALVKTGFEGLEAPLRALTKLIPGGNKTFMPKLVNGMFDKFNKAVYDFIAGKGPLKKKGEPTAVAGDARYSGQIAGDKARNDILLSGMTLNNKVKSNADAKSLMSDKAPASWSSALGAIRTIIQNESGWNAGAVNLTDSNAKAGHPSQGLMQTIAGTYNAYKNPNFDYGMKDGVSNVTAGINYSDSRYSGVTNVPGVRAVGGGGRYVGYGSGGVVQNFHTGGVVRGLNKNSGANSAMSALLSQAGITFPTGPAKWDGRLGSQMRKRLAGVNKGQDVQHTGTRPYANSLPLGDSSTTKRLMNWVDKNDPKTYTNLWRKQPVGHSSIFQNTAHADPLLPIMSYLGNSATWKNYRKNKEAAYWANVTKHDNEGGSKKTKGKATPTTHAGFRNLESVKNFIRSTDKLPYVFGADGPESYDCSGLVSSVWSRLTHKHDPNTRAFSTFNESHFFKPGKGDGVFVVGFSNNSRMEHTAGRLDGLGFEARSSADGIIVGNKAMRPENFDHVMHLPADKIKGVGKAPSKDKKLSVADEKKKHPKMVKTFAKQRSEWSRDLKVLQKAAGTEKNRIGALRKMLGMKGAGNNKGLYSGDMEQPVDHAMAHALGLSHPADWQHPWSGAVTATQTALAQQDRSNSLNAEWTKDLSTIAGWGYVDLVDYLLEKGISDGLTLAKSAVADKNTAKQLNDSIAAGANATTSGSDGATQLKIIAKLGSGTKAKPFGLRDVSTYLNSPDYTVVNLFDKMTAQLKKLPTDLTSKFSNDVKLFQQGLFYANRGAIVPGDMSQNRDMVPASLTPGEGVLSRKGMAALGESNFNRLNSGIPVQFLNNGGVVLAPQISGVGLGSAANLVPNARAASAGAGSNMPATVNLNTNIYNPTGQNSVYSMNKNLRRQAALGTVQKAAGNG